MVCTAIDFGADGVGVGDGDAVVVGVGVGCATEDGFGGEIFTPLLQIIFLQIAPGLTAALEVGALTDKANAPINAVAIERFIGNILLSS